MLLSHELTDYPSKPEIESPTRHSAHVNFAIFTGDEYSKKLTYDTAIASKAAYNGTKKSEYILKLEKEGYTIKNFGYYPELNKFDGLIAYRKKANGTMETILAYRGTEDKRDALSDIHVSISKINGVNVHAGFLNRYRKSASEVDRILQNISQNGAIDLKITGHSLGGGVASIAALEMCKKYETSLVTYAAPAAFAQKVDLNLKNNFRYTIKGDIVPDSTGYGFYHATKNAHVLPSDNNNPLKDHSLDNYLRIIFEEKEVTPTISDKSGWTSSFVYGLSSILSPLARLGLDFYSHSFPWSFASAITSTKKT